MEKNSDGKSLDLLSAALNQSGLINCNEKTSATKDSNKSKITSQGGQVTINKQFPNSSPVVVSSSANKIVSIPPKPAQKLMKIPGAKIIKLPSLSSGSVFKIKKVVQPAMLKVNSGNSNKIQISSLPVSKKEALPVSITTMSTPAVQSNTNNERLSKVMAGGKAIFIPIKKNDNTKTFPVKLVQSPVKQSPLSTSSSLPMIKLRVKPTSSLPSLKNSINIHSKLKSQTQSSLNLGSMFVESAEKEVGSDFDTPPGSPYTVGLTQNVLLKPEENKKGNVLKTLKVVEGRISNGTASGHITSKLTSSQSIPTIRLSLTSKNSTIDDRTKSLSKEALLRAMSLPLMSNPADEELVADDEKEEEMQHSQTYSEYMPSKLQIGLPHPDSVVETSSLASITPPNVHYRLSLPNQTIDLGQLSALQLESIVYACQKHKTFLPSGERAGFLIGDGAGVGKGRSVAGIIYENYLVGRKRALWFSVSNDLKFDAERDLRDIGAKHIKVYSLNKFKYGKITSRNNGAFKKGVIFATYSSLIGESHSQAKYHTRLKQLLHWCGEDFDGPIIFDECHKAKNLVPSGSGKSTKTGVTVLELQNKLPNARVVYASATGASEPRNMAYMSRLGLWGPGTPFNDFSEFIQAVERRGVGAMELVAMDMKLRGCYIARQLSFYGVSFKIEEVALDSAFISTYNKSVKLWVAAREAFQAAASMMEAEYHMKKSMWGQFWSAHQRFFKYLCLSAKVKHTVALVREAVKHGKCVVIGLQSTGEAGTVDQLEKQGGALEDFVSTAKNVFENVIERHFPAPDRRRVVALLGRDFYKKPDRQGDEKENEGGKKRKLEDGSEVDSKKMRRNSSNDDPESSHDDSSDDIISDQDDINFSDSSSLSEEDIGKIFGDVSDSDEHDSPVKKKKKNSDDVCSDDDSGLKMEVKKSDLQEENPGLLSSLDLVSGTLTSALPGMGPVEKAQALKKELLNRLLVLGPHLPNNMLDELIDALGGTENVAEMTGRKGRVISTDEGNVVYQSRAENDVPVELLNITEKQRFMDGEKNIAIISEAASSGISLQADKRVRNQRKRVHVTVELPWSADRAVQQFGRTHRSNQVNAPEYVFLITELAGEQRFASVVAKRLESLGALTHGDRRATESRDLSKFNYDNKYGRKALDTIMKAIAGHELPLVSPPSSYKGSFFKDIRQGLLGVGLLNRDTGQVNYQLDKDYNNIFKFMNRILGMEVEQQNAIFTFFSDTLAAIIAEAKRLGEYDQGIMDVGVTNNLVERVKCRDFPLDSGGAVSLHTVRVERGTSWEEAQRLYQENSLVEENGFYVTFQKKNDRHMVMLAIECSSKRHRSLFLVHRPNTGKQTRRESLHEITKKYQRVDEEEAQRWWEEQYQASLDHCSHRYWQGSCSRGGPNTCHVGMRRRMYHVLSGSVLQVWKTVETILSSEGGFKYKMQIVRLKTSDGGKLVGLLIPSTCVMELTSALTDSAYETNHCQPSSPTSDYDVDHVQISDDDSDEYEEVDEIDPDRMLSSVLFSKKQFSWS